MNSFADAFGDAERERFAADNVIIGAVILTYVADTNPPKEKRLIIVGNAFDHVTVATVYLNSELNFNVFPTQELQDLNPEFTAEGRDYLDHDSHVDCSSLHILKKDFLQGIIGADPARSLGNISEEDLQQLRTLIKGAKTIKPGVKKNFGLFL